MQSTRPRILAIDDTPANLFTLGMALDAEFDVQIATSGAQGLRLAEQTPPDLILLDVMMPEMDGFETCRRLKLQPALQSIPVIFITALTDIASESEGLALGAVDYITKPVNVDIARMRIRNLVQRKRAEDGLKQQLLFGQALNQMAQDIIDGDDRAVFLQASCRVLIGALGLEPALLEPMARTLAQSLSHGEGLPEWLGQACGNRVWTEQERQFLQAVGQQVRLALGKMELLEAQARAREKIELAASVFTHAREGIIITRLDGTIVEVNNAFTRITGFAREEAVGGNPRLLNSGRQSQEFFATMWHQLEDKGHWYGELWNRRKNGELYAQMLTITTVRDAQGRAENYVALFTDITAFKAHEEQLQHIAHYDALTNLPNRVLLADRLRQGMVQDQRRGKKLAVVFIDLDGFKAVNDAYGHAMGDLLLVQLTSVMKQALREGDTLARIGGDEFVAVLVELEDVADAHPILKRLLAATSQQVTVNDVALRVSASVGVTFFPQLQPVEADQLLRQADQAMYQAKLSGKNRFSIFDALEDRGIRSFHESIERMRQGLANQEFVLHYQPKVNMLTGAVIGAEALIRWLHPQGGLLAPGLFLPAIDNHPLAIELGEWVIDSALTQIEAWQAQGIGLAVSVNVGARQIQQPQFVKRLKDILQRHPQVPPAKLEIEILETSALEDLERVAQVIEDCRALGVLFAMDDFGTGYSSLTYLRRLRVNLLKIDQSFVRDMLDDVEDLTILQGVIGLAKSFRRNAIAEGVESVAHGRLLLQLGCELAQGYGIAKPMPAAEFPKWLRNWRPDASWRVEAAIEPEHVPLLYAGIEHRAWIAAIGAHLRGERMAPAALDFQQCNFGKWFEGDGQARLGTSVALDQLNSLHRQIHALGKELMALQARGFNAEALARFPEMERLRDALIEQLEVLAHGEPVGVVPADAQGPSLRLGA